ncbi:MAG TPA: PorP/SprF family type IX secretion system membrane protein [Mucilaginibacter sp.]|nr:PorP/SprF family type IX secretion system membrane protein [Mucilaginibacter sp.]
MKKAIIFIIILQVVAVSRLRAQVDPHFSQYYAYPMWLNPALTGVFNGDVRIGANYKNQWANIDNGYNTGGVSADFRSGEKAGFGINIMNQAAGNAGYNYFAAYGSFGYGISISADGTQRLHFGVQAGFINRSFDPNKLQFGDQYSPYTGFDPNIPNFENFATTSAIVFDSSTGIYYYDGNSEHGANPFFGVSLAHLTQSKDAFAEEGLNSRIPLRYTIHGGVKLRITDDYDLTPNFIFMKQQANELKALGIYNELKTDDDKSLIFGLLYRVNDAAAASVGYHLNNMNIGLSYDINSSGLNAATHGQGGLELSFSYIFGKHEPEGPEPVCPRF